MKEPPPHRAPTDPYHVKNAQRLDDSRLAEVLNERGMAEREDIDELLQAARAGGVPFCEAVVLADLVSDWDMSRVVAELFQLPFLPVDICKPDKGLWEELGSPMLRQRALVPLARFGKLLTVAMPGLVSADALSDLAAETDCVVLPVVGTVRTNRRWLDEQSAPGLEAGQEGAGGWSSLFDEGDAAVQASLDGPEEGTDTAELEFEDEDMSLEPPSLIETSPEEQGDGAADVQLFELPPVPDFES